MAQLSTNKLLVNHHTATSQDLPSVFRVFTDLLWMDVLDSSENCKNRTSKLIVFTILRVSHNRTLLVADCWRNFSCIHFYNHKSRVKKFINFKNH